MTISSSKVAICVIIITLILCFTNSNKVVVGKEIENGAMNGNTIPCGKGQSQNCKPGNPANPDYSRGCISAEHCRGGHRMLRQ